MTLHWRLNLGRFQRHDRLKPPQIRCSAHGPRRSVCRPSTRSSRSISRRPSSTALAEHRAEIDAIAADTAAPTFDNTVEALERSGRAARPGRRASSSCSRAPTPTRRSRRSSATWRRCSPRHCNEIYLNDGAVRRGSTPLSGRRRELGLSRRAGAGAGALPSPFRRAGAGLDAAAKHRLAADRRAARDASAPRSARTCWPTRRPTCCRSADDDLAGLPDFACAPRRAAPPRSAASPASTSSRCRAPASSRSCSSPPGATCARRRSAPGSRAARTAATTDNRAIIAETGGAARRARAAARLSRASRDFQLDDTMAKTPEAVRDLLDAVWGRRARARCAERDALQALVRDGGRQLRARAVGLALLRREAAQGALRSRRERDQAVPASSTT